MGEICQAPLSPGGLAGALALLRGGGLARPLLYLADGVAKSEEGKGKPGALCLLGFANETVDWQLTERLSKVVCLCLAGKAGVPAPAFQVPPSWQFEAEASARQLWG